MIDKNEVGRGAVRRTVPFWLTICLILLIGLAMPGWLDVFAGVLVFLVVVVMCAACYMTGWADGAGEVLPLVNEQAALLDKAADEMGPLKLTGGGPLDGDTVPNPADVPRLLVYDPENEELEGYYIQDLERPGVLVWQPAEEEEDDAT